MATGLSSGQLLTLTQGCYLPEANSIEPNDTVARPGCARYNRARVQVGQRWVGPWSLRL